MFSKDTLQKLKGVILGLILVLGISVAMASWNPPGGTPSTSNNEKAPLNVGSSDQAKNGSTVVGSKLDINGVLSSNALTVWTGGTSNLLGNVLVGNPSIPDALNSTIKISSLSHGATGKSTSDYPASVCADENGTLILCDGVQLPSGDVQLTLSETSYTQPYTNEALPTFSRTVNLAWTIPSGATCTTGGQTITPSGNATGWPLAYTINSNGSTSVTINKFKTTTFNISCDYNGSTIPASVTYTASGIDTFTSGAYTFYVPANVTSLGMGVAAGGGGGGGGADAGADGGGGSDSCVRSGTTGTCDGSALLRAQGGTGGNTGGGFNESIAGGPGGTGYTNGSVTPSAGANGTANGGNNHQTGGGGGVGGTSGGASGGKGGHGYNAVQSYSGGGGGGGGAAVSKTISVTAGSSYKVIAGAGGAGGASGTGDQGVDATDGVYGRVIFNW